MPSSDTSELALVALDVFGHGLATARTLRANYGTPVLADLQASNSGELLKALLLGASTVSVDAMVSRCEERFSQEVPGDLIFREGVRVKLETSGSEDSAAVAMGVATHKIDARALRESWGGLQDLGVSALAETSKALDQGLLRLERQLPRVVSFQDEREMGDESQRDGGNSIDLSAI
eukprot:g16246.t1